MLNHKRRFVLYDSLSFEFITNIISVVRSNRRKTDKTLVKFH